MRHLHTKGQSFETNRQVHWPQNQRLINWEWHQNTTSKEKKSSTAITQECRELYWISPGDNTQQNSSCTATYQPSRKLFKLDEPRHCWKSKDELISNLLQRTPSHRWAKLGRPARTYMQQPCGDTGCSLEDMPGAMNDRDRWWERVREIRVRCLTSWWW